MGLFKSKPKRPKLFFAVVISDHDTQDLQFTSNKDQKMFIVTGDVDKYEVIPRTTLKEVVERFINPKPPEGEVSITEKTT